MLMRGASYARKFLADYLEAEFPPLLEQARQEFNLSTLQLPDPLRYDCYDPLKVEVYPSVGSVVRSTTNWRRNDLYEVGAESYSARYRMLAFLWVKTPEDKFGNYPDNGYEAAMSLRDDMLGLMRSCLLTKPSLNSNGEAEMDESTLGEDYLDAIKQSDESPIWFAGGTITFDMRVSEQNRHTALGEADGLDLGIDSNAETME